jgi:hypothetical protein
VAERVRALAGRLHPGLLEREPDDFRNDTRVGQRLVRSIAADKNIPTGTTRPAASR